MRFKAAILTELNSPLVIDQVEAPQLEVGQILVKVHASGICGAQIGEITGTKGPDPWLPHLMGHEGGGEVLDIGPGVTRVKKGDHVVMHWRKALGIEAKPPKYRWNGNFVGGGWVTTFNEMAVVSENRLTKIDKDIPFEVAALMGCAVTTALGLVNNEAKIMLGESVLVIGCGGVGLNVIQGSDLVGAHPIIAADLHLWKLVMAEEAGATHVVGTNSEHWQNVVMDISGKRGVDVVVDCTGNCGIIAAGYELLATGGRMVLVGQPAHDACLTLPSMRQHYKGKTVLDSQGGLTQPEIDIPRYLKLYQSGKLCLDEFITHRYPLDKVNEAVAAIQRGEVGRCILEMA